MLPTASVVRGPGVSVSGLPDPDAERSTVTRRGLSLQPFREVESEHRWRVAGRLPRQRVDPSRA
jgi:hypothetical protein